MKLILFADLHHYSGDRETATFNKTQKLTQYALPMLDELIRKVNIEHRPDAVVNLGDSIQDGNDYKRDIESLREVAQKVRQFDCPYYMVLGNHDLKMFDSMVAAQEIFGHKSFNYSVDIEGYHLVFMTNGIKPERGTIGGGVEKTRVVVGSVLEWLNADLDKANKPCIIFTHFPFIACDGLDERHLIENLDEVFKIIDGHKNIIGVVSGHTHKAYRKKRCDVDYYVLGSPTASSAGDEIPDSVYYQLDIKANKVEIKELKLNL